MFNRLLEKTFTRLSLYLFPADIILFSIFPRLSWCASFPISSDLWYQKQSKMRHRRGIPADVCGNCEVWQFERRLRVVAPYCRQSGERHNEQGWLGQKPTQKPKRQDSCRVPLHYADEELTLGAIIPSAQLSINAAIVKSGHFSYKIRNYSCLVNASLSTALRERISVHLDN